MSDSDTDSTLSDSDFEFNRLSRAAERERVYLDPEHPEQSYIMLYTEEYLEDDNVWDRRYYPRHVPEKTEESETGDQKPKN